MQRVLRTISRGATGVPANKTSATIDLLVPLLTAALVTFPLWFATYPPLLDYPFHLARMAILRDLAAGGPMARYYEFGSFLIPNVGMDVVILALSGLVGVEIAGRLFLAATLALTVTGAGFLARTLHGRTGLAPLLAGLLVFNQTFASGFLNYLLAVALLPWAVAGFLRLRSRGAAARLAGGALFAGALYFAHIVGFVLYAAAVAALELHASLPRLRREPAAAVASLAVAALPPVLVLALFALASPTAREAGSAIGYGGVPTALGFIRWKLLLPLRQLTTDNARLDGISAAAALAIAALVAVAGRVRIKREMLAVLAVLLAIMVAAPAELFTARYVDTRLPVAILVLLAGSLDIAIDRPRMRGLAVAAPLALLTLRSAVVARDWIGFDRIEREAAEAYRALPPDSILFAAAGGMNPERSFDDTWRPPIAHLAALAVLAGGKFVPAVWAHPAQQPIRVRPAYADLYSFQARDALEMPDTQAFTGFVAEIRDLMSRRRAQGLDDFGGRVFLVLLFPAALDHPSVPGAREISRHDRFSIYQVTEPG